MYTCLFIYSYLPSPFVVLSSKDAAIKLPQTLKLDTYYIYIYICI